MDNDKEVTALLSLIEDPDVEVFESVSNRIISYGAPIIPQLEDLWESSFDSLMQDRIETLIHRLHAISIKNDFKEWSQAPHHDLLPGALLIAKLVYPDIQTAKVIQDIERLRRSIWIELNNYLTPVEQINVFSSILYNHFGLTGTSITHPHPNDFLIPNILSSKKGNQSGNGLLYLLLAEHLDIPIKLLPIPQQFVLGYFKSTQETAIEKLHQNINFFVDPISGQAFSHNDLYNFFNRIALPIKPNYFKPLNNIQTIQKLLADLSSCYNTENKHYMISEINDIIALLEQ